VHPYDPPSRIRPAHAHAASTFLPALLTWGYPGAAWFFHGLSVPPPGARVPPIDARTEMVVWQLGSCAPAHALAESIRR
jgi:hypothetical protein